VPLSRKYMIAKKARDATKKARRAAKANPALRRKLTKDPGIPNLNPFKATILARLEEQARLVKFNDLQRQRKQQDLVRCRARACRAADAARARWRRAQSRAITYPSPSRTENTQARAKRLGGGADDQDVVSLASPDLRFRSAGVFVRAGAVLPMLPRSLAGATGVAAQQYSSLEFNVFPGAERGGARVYEDDGLSTDYLLGRYAETTLAYAPSARQGCTMYTVATNGSYTGMVRAGRLYSVFVLAAPLPASADVDGAPLAHAPNDGTPNSWFYTSEGDIHAFLPPAQDALPPTVLTVCF
jgi:hypothetical protein